MFVLLVVSLIAMQANPEAAPGKKVRPRVELRASPRIISGSPLGQPRVLLTLVITNADEKYWCPEILWRWPNGTHSTQEGDCPPFAQATAADLARKSWTRYVPIFLGPGPQAIVAVLRKSGKTIAKAETAVIVTGAE